MGNWTFKRLRWAKPKQPLSSAVLLDYSGTPVVQYGLPRTRMPNVAILYHAAWHWVTAEKHSNLGGWQPLYIHRTATAWTAYNTSFFTASAKILLYSEAFHRYTALLDIQFLLKIVILFMLLNIGSSSNLRGTDTPVILSRGLGQHGRADRLHVCSHNLSAKPENAERKICLFSTHRAYRLRRIKQSWSWPLSPEPL